MSGSPGVPYGFELGSDAGLAKGPLNLEMKTKDPQLGGFTGTVLGGWAFSLCLEVPDGQEGCHLNCPHLAAPGARPLCPGAPALWDPVFVLAPSLHCPQMFVTAPCWYSCRPWPHLKASLEAGRGPGSHLSLAGLPGSFLTPFPRPSSGSPEGQDLSQLLPGAPSQQLSS